MLFRRRTKASAPINALRVVTGFWDAFSRVGNIVSIEHLDARSWAIGNWRFRLADLPEAVGSNIGNTPDSCHSLRTTLCQVWTHRSRRRFSRRVTGLPSNLTFPHAAEKVIGGDSSRSPGGKHRQDQIPAERLLPTAAHSRFRPRAVDRGEELAVLKQSLIYVAIRRCLHRLVRCNVQGARRSAARSCSWIHTSDWVRRVLSASGVSLIGNDARLEAADTMPFEIYQHQYTPPSRLGIRNAE